MTKRGARNRLGHVPRPGHRRGTHDARYTGALYREWQKAVIDRDGRCVRCGETRRSLLTADHIVRWADDPAKRLDLANGRAMCRRCHARMNGETRHWSKATKARMRADPRAVTRHNKAPAGGPSARAADQRVDLPPQAVAASRSRP